MDIKGKQKNILIIAILIIAVTAISFAIVKVLKTEKSTKTPDVLVVTPPDLASEACYKSIVIQETPTYGTCDEDSCVQTDCEDPHNCPIGECVIDDDCEEAPPAQKYKACVNQSCVEKICPQSGCPSNSCNSNDDCVNEVENPPVCKELSATPKKGTADLKVRFDVDATGDNLETYQFDFGDGEEVDSPNDTIFHTYKKGGNFEASVKVINAKGEKTDRDDCKVTVKVDSPTYMTCKNQACVEVEGEGDGVDTCSSNLDCQSSIPLHLECRDSSCVPISGAGQNMCTTNVDCGAQPVTQVPVTGNNIPLLLGGLVSSALIILGLLIL